MTTVTMGVGGRNRQKEIKDIYSHDGKQYAVHGLDTDENLTGTEIVPEGHFSTHISIPIELYNQQKRNKQW